MSWGELFAAAIRDRTNPPLFYALLKAWIAIGGETVAWIRLLPCLLGVAVAAPLYALARQFKLPDGATVVALAAAAASPLLVTLSNEVRGYSLLLLLSCLSLLAFSRLSDEGAARYERGLALLLVNAALVYTHYFGWLVVAAELGAAAIWHRRALVPAGLAAIGAGLLFTPWAVAVAAEAAARPRPLANVEWITPPVPGDFPRFYDALVARVLTPGTAWIGLIVVGAALLGVALSRERRVSLQLLWYSAFPVAAVFAASLMLPRSAFVPRYLIVAAPAYWLLLGLGVSRLPTGDWRLASGAVFAAFTLTAGGLQRARGGEKILWGAIVDHIAAQAGPAGATVYSFEGFTGLPLEFYARTTGSRLTIRPIRRLDEVRAPSWVVYREGSFPAPIVPARALSLRGLTPGAELREQTLSLQIVAFPVR